MSYGVGRRPGLDPALLWLWCRLAAPAPIRPLAWEPRYATSAALEKAKRQKKKKKKNQSGDTCIEGGPEPGAFLHSSPLFSHPACYVLLLFLF